MKESLEAARNIHQILIVVCTIVVIFSVSMNHSANKYDFALEEIINLENALKDVSDNRTDIIVKSLDRGAEVNLEKLDSLTAGKGRQVKIDGMTIEGIHSAFLLNWSRIDSVEIYDYQKNQLFFGNFSAMTFLLTTIRNFPENAAPIPYGENKVLTKRVYDPACSYIRRLKRDGLLDSISKSNSFLPKTRNVWREIKMCSLDSAKVVLDEKAREFAMISQNDVDLSGFRVAGKYMFIVGPLIMLGLLLYLSRLLKHIRAIFVNDDPVIYSFPWLGLFPDKVSQGMVFGSIVGYPIVAALLLTWNSNLPVDRAIYWLAIYVAIFYLVSSQLAAKVYDLQNRMFGETTEQSTLDSRIHHETELSQNDENDAIDDLLNFYSKYR